MIINANNETDARQELMEKFKLACNKLAELEDKLENGTLIELPCKVGDEIYYIPSSVSRPKVLLGTIIAIRIEKHGYGIQIQESPYNGYYGNTALGIDWFLTKEEAEARLKELQNEKE